MIREYGKIGEFQVYGLRKQWNLAAQVGTNELYKWRPRDCFTMI